MAVAVWVAEIGVVRLIESCDGIIYTTAARGVALARRAVLARRAAVPFIQEARCD